MIIIRLKITLIFDKRGKKKKSINNGNKRQKLIDMNDRS